VSALATFERAVVAALVSDHLPAHVVESVLENAELVSFEATGAGYLLTVAHPLLPAARTVCNTPMLIGRADDLECGFVVFLENGELTLECHAWSDALPDDFRTRDVRVEETT
jgi:hypothetical protein